MGQTSKSGHAALIAIEKVTDPAGTFTDVAELMGTIGPPKLARAKNKRVPHGDAVPTYLVSDVTDEEEITLDLDYLQEHATHDLVDGFQKRYQDKTRFGVMFKGPNWVLDTTDQILHSCRCIGVEITAGTEAEPYSMKVTLQADGPYKKNATIYGASGTWS